MIYQTTIFWLNMVSSLALVMACWWLAHTYSVAGYPHGKLIAALWGLIGVSVAVTAFARYLYLNPNPTIIISKLLLVLVCAVIARRVSINRRALQAYYEEHGDELGIRHPPREGVKPPEYNG